MQRSSSEPHRFRVVVRGRLSEHIARGFEHLELESGGGQSSLTGTFADHAQLHGLLDRLRDLGIQLVSVNPVDSRVTTGTGARKRCTSARGGG